MHRTQIIPLLLGLAVSVAHGQQTARVVKYHANDIVNVRAKMRYTTLIQLPASEKILEVATGDKDFWIIDTVGNYCFLHPAKEGIHSNLNLITDKGGVYSFIILHRVRDGYVTLLDIFRTVISAGQLEALLIEVGARFSATSYVGMAQDVYLARVEVLAPFGFEMDRKTNQYVAPWSEALEELIAGMEDIEARVYTRKAYDPEQRERWQSVHYWYWEHWKFFRSEVKTSIVQGIAVFLSLFETDPDVRRVFCPPKELYRGDLCPADLDGQVMPAFEELIEQGKIVGLNFPVALNPALAKTIGTMMKVDYQRAVQLRILKMDAEPDRHFRPTVFICDEYQNFATVTKFLLSPSLGHPEFLHQG